MGCFYPKKKMYELKTYRGVICHDNEEWFKIWRGTDLSVETLDEEFDKFWPEHWKISKICTLIGRFLPKYISYQYVSIYSEQWCLMALMIIDTKFEGKLTCAFKNDMKNLANFRSEAKK